MRKLISLILCLMLVCTGVALAYDGSAPVTEENKTISILTTNSGSKRGGFENMIWWQAVLEKANITLDMEYIDNSSYSDAMRPRLAAGVDLADIVRPPAADSDMSCINSGIFTDLAEYYEKDAFNISKLFEKYDGLKASLTTPEGGMYYVPSLSPADANMRCMMINRHYLEALGMTIDQITDIESHTEYLRAVKAADCNGNGDPDDEIPLFMRSGMMGLNRMYNCSCLPFFAHRYESKQCIQVRAAIDKMAPFVVNPSIGYTYYLDDENEIINAYAADLSTYFTENDTAFIMGTRSLDEWDEYVETVKSMGVDELIAVYQAGEDRGN